jgi:hypothetical protein
MNYRIAIPSYNRVKELGEKSLATLSKHGYETGDIDIFVADSEQYNLYKSEYPEYNIVVAVLGMKEVRNFIFQEYYKEGQKVLSMDDDIEKMRMKNPRGWEPSQFCDDELDLKKEIELAFKECEKSGRHLWGVYPVENHFFMKNDITFDYKFLGGWMWGTIINKEALLLEIGDGACEDYERCMKHYLKDGGMVRLNYLCCKTKYGNPKGGMPPIEERGREEFFKEAGEKYKNLFYLKKKKGGLNPVLKDTRIKPVSQITGI